MTHLDLYFRKYPTKGLPPLVILHGMMGSSRNWDHCARGLSTGFEVFSLDLRNHGHSPHHPVHTYESMVDDVWNWARVLPRFYLLGHSMGGKVAMRMACSQPNRILGLVVVDTSPRGGHHPAKSLQPLKSLNLKKWSSFTVAKRKMMDLGIPEKWSDFLTTNLRKDGEGLAWRCNLPALLREENRMIHDSLEQNFIYSGPSLFLLGGKSPAVPLQDYHSIRTHFPMVDIQVLPQAGHNPHTESPQAFTQKVLNFALKS